MTDRSDSSWPTTFMYASSVIDRPASCTTSLLLPYYNFGVGASSFQSPRSPVLCFFSLYSFLLHVFLITSLHLSFSILMFGVHFHVLIATSSSVFLSSRHMAELSQSRFSYCLTKCLPHLPLLLFLLP